MIMLEEGRRTYVWMPRIMAIALGLTLSATGHAFAGDQPIRFGVRTDVPPMAYMDQKDGKIKGYSVDICDAVKRTFALHYPNKTIADGYVKVTASDRQEKLLNGDVDTICGAFSVTEARMKKFDFSFLTFASGASVATRRRSRSLLSTMEQQHPETPARVAVVSRTTTQSFVEALLGTSVTIEPKATHDEAFKALADGKVDYYFGDRVIINGVITQGSQDKNKFIVGGRFLTYEPYAMPFVKGKNLELRHAANLTISKLYRSRRILKIFGNHFEGQRPSNLLQSLFQLYSIPE